MRSTSTIVSHIQKPSRFQKCSFLSCASSSSPPSSYSSGFTTDACRNNNSSPPPKALSANNEVCYTSNFRPRINNYSFISADLTGATNMSTPTTRSLKDRPVGVTYSTVARRQLPRSFSSSGSLSQSVQLSPCHSCSSSINLLPLIPSSILQTIRTLPEVEQVLDSFQRMGRNGNSNAKPLLDGLERASQIFQHVGDAEHKAVVLLKATLLSQCCRYNESIQALNTIIGGINSGDIGHDEAPQKYESENERFIILSCLLKMHWYSGSFEKGVEYANIINDMAPSQTSSASLKQGCAMNALALSQLLTLGRLKDVDIHRIEARRGEIGDQQSQEEYSWQDVMDILSTLKLSSRTLENAYRSTPSYPTYSSIESVQLALASASSYCNQGVVDLICNIMQNRSNLSNGSMEYTIPFDSAMKTWRDGLNILEDLEKKSQNGSPLKEHHTFICKSMMARLYCNMAWAIIFTPSYISNELKAQPIKEDQLKIASEYSSLSLKLCDEVVALCTDNGMTDMETSFRPLMGRALGLVASCYARAGSAVTAEGLLQSAMGSLNMDKKNECPLTYIDSRSVLLYYSSLCSNWEKREADAKKHEEFALNVNNQYLSESFRGLSAIYSGLWLFVISDFECV